MNVFFKSEYAYRGGFSTSIVDSLFADNEHRHSDCCVLTCCGILLYDRNNYLLTDQRPSWKKRCFGAVFCVGLFVFLITVATVSAPQQQQQQQQHQEREGDDQLVQEGTTPEGSEETPDKSQHIVSGLFGLSVGVGFYFLFNLARHRYNARRSLMARLYKDRLSSATPQEGEAEDSDQRPASHATPLVATSSGHATVGTFLKLQDTSIRAATRVCGCIPRDAIADVSTTGEEISGDNEASCYGTDLCHCLWKSWSSVFFGAWCGCWCQCLGLCAMAQEDRELHRLFPKERFLMDYITFQPFSEYAPKLQALRQNKVNNLMKHVQALSQLSRNLLRVLLGFLGGLTLFAFTGVDPSFQPIHLAVVVMVLFQAFIIVYFVHWQFGRFDLSVDAVIKYFASGFILCTTNAFVYEMLVSIALGIVSWSVRLAAASTTAASGRTDLASGWVASLGAASDDVVAASDDVAAAYDEAAVQLSTPIWVLAIAAFLNAFIVAALVEEVCKYFGFWMVVHPDLLIPNDGDPDHKEGEETNLILDQTAAQSTATTAERQSLKSLGAGITIAMVTTAVGFACCENFMYVFLYTRPANPVTEISTLLARSIFPVHPLAAAIQSIGVCRRDIEKDHSMGFGRILFPALVLHGSFDFALMFLELLMRQSINSDADGDADGSNSDAAGTSVDDPTVGDEEGLVQQLSGLISSVSIVLIGIIYYVIRALAQRRRLVELDNGRPSKSEYEQLL